MARARGIIRRARAILIHGRRRHLAFLAFLVALSSAGPVLAADTWVIQAAKIYPSPYAEPIEDGVVLVRAGRIAYVGKRDSARIPKSARTSDCTGGVLTAGFQNNHVHFIEPRWEDAAHKPAATLAQSLKDMLTRYGFTTVFDTASDQANTFALRVRVEKGEIPGPRILTVGLPLFPPDGIPSYIKDLPPQMLARMHQPRTAEEARAAVRANLGRRRRWHQAVPAHLASPGRGDEDVSGNSASCRRRNSRTRQAGDGAPHYARSRPPRTGCGR